MTVYLSLCMTSGTEKKKDGLQLQKDHDIEYHVKLFELYKNEEY